MKKRNILNFMVKHFIILIVSFTVTVMLRHCYSTILWPLGLELKSPKQITTEENQINDVTLLCEDVMILKEKDSVLTGIMGVASFETNNKIYMMGHNVPGNILGKYVYEDVITNQEIGENITYGKVISNEKLGVIAQKSQFLDIEKYSKIEISQNIHLGEAYILKPDDGGYVQYPIEIEFFDEENEDIYYSSSEFDFIKGSSGCPIIQNEKIVGIHYANRTAGKSNFGIAHPIWKVLPKVLSETSDDNSSLVSSIRKT